MKESIPLKVGLRVALLIPCAAALVYGSYVSLRLSYADLLFHKNTTASVQRAAEIEPRNGRYQAWLAELLENDGRDGTRALNEAARLNPLDSRVWIRLGLNAETAGDRGRAERLLLHAASIDRLFEPRWALMNFYFRCGNEEQFWNWARQAFRISYGDRAPMFELCWRMREDAALMEAKALPADGPLLTQFVRFLAEKGRLVEAAALSERLVAQARPEDADAFKNVAERLAEAGDMARAVRLWNALCDRRLLPFAPLDPARGQSVTNGSFAEDPTGAGFDWRVTPATGVSSGRMTASGGYRFTFAGTQPDACDLIAQTVPLEPSRSYRLRLSYRTSGISGASGLRLHALDGAVMDLASDEWTTATLLFSSGASRAGTITVDYRRPAGAVRIEGRLELREVVLEFAP